MVGRDLSSIQGRRVQSGGDDDVRLTVMIIKAPLCTPIEAGFLPVWLGLQTIVEVIG